MAVFGSQRVGPARFMGSLLLILVAIIPGGLMNRIRGGWNPFKTDWASLPGDNMFTHDGSLRLLMAAGCGVLVGVLTRRLKRGVGLAIIVTLLTYFILFIGWGCYFGIGESPDAKARVGAYDWLVGPEEEGWGHWRRWSRDIVGMSLRGLTWTAPPGLLLLLYGFGWVPLLNGIMMGPVYWMCQAIPVTAANFTQGTPLAEFVWGCWIWLCYIVPMVAMHRKTSLRRSSVAELHTPVAFTPRVAVFAHTGLALTELILVGSCVSYGMVDESDRTLDTADVLRNREQTLIGLACATTTMLLLHAWLLRRQCERNRRRGTYEFTSLWRRTSVDGGYGTRGDAGSDDGGSDVYRAYPELEDDNPYARAKHSGLNMYVAPDGEEVADFGSVRLFDAAAESMSDRAEKVVTAVHTVLCVPPDDHEVDPGPVASPTGAVLTPSGCCLIGIACLILTWTLLVTALLVYVAIVDEHYFGNPPFVHD